MTYRVEFTEEARLDAQETWFWYENQKVGLGNEFLLSLEATLYTIERNPLHYQQLYNEVRIVPAKKIPIQSRFFLNGNIIGIIGVLHARRNPTIWLSRTK